MDADRAAGDKDLGDSSDVLNLPGFPFQQLSDTPTFPLDVSRAEEETEEDKRAKAYADAGGRGEKGARYVPEDVLSGQATMLLSNVSKGGSSSTSPTTKSDVVTPIVDPENFLKSLIDSLPADRAKTTGMFDAYTNELTKMQAEKQYLDQQYYDAIGIEGTANNAVAKAQAQVEAQSGNMAVRTLTSLALNPRDRDRFEAEMLMKKRDTEFQLVRKRQEINDKEAQIPTLISNPIGYVMGHLALTKDIEEHNNLNAMSKQLTSSIGTLTNTFQQVHAAEATSLSLEKATEWNARADLATVSAKRAQIEAQRNAVMANSGFLEKQLNANLTLSQNLRSDISTLQTADRVNEEKKDRELARIDRLEGIDLRKKAEMRAQAEFDWRKDEKKRKDDLEDTDRKQKAADLASANSALQMMGMTPVYSIEQFNRMPEAIKVQVTYIMRNGGTRIAPSTTGAIEVVKMGNPALMPKDLPVMLETATAAQQVIRRRLSTDNAFLGNSKDEQAKIEEVQTKQMLNGLQLDTRSQISDIPNIYAAPGLQTMLGKPNLQGTYIQKTLSQLEQINPNASYTDRAIVNVMMEGLKKHEISLTQAAQEMTLYFREASRHNNEARQFEKWNLEKQSHYVFDKIDWMDINQVSLELTRQWAKYISPAFGMGVMPFQAGGMAQLRNEPQRPYVNAPPSAAKLPPMVGGEE